MRKHCIITTQQQHNNNTTTILTTISQVILAMSSVGNDYINTLDSKSDSIVIAAFCLLVQILTLGSGLHMLTGAVCVT